MKRKYWVTTEMKQINYDYYEWLKSQVDIPNGKSYDDLFEKMHNLEFVWTVPNDDNRVQDGLDLRPEYANGKVSDLVLEGVTFLEVLVALSRRLEFTAGGEARQWAWRLLKNLRLHKSSDPLTEARDSRVRDILDAVIWRTYERDGRGGFFPLHNPAEDQTKVEIWYQMNAYVIEMNAV
jgi:hypothetical protein